jgi:hypothetical protein
MLLLPKPSPPLLLPHQQLDRPYPPPSFLLPPDQQILIMSAPRTAIETYWRSIQAPATSSISKNASLSPVVRQLSDLDLAFSGQNLSLGHCSVIVRRTIRKGTGLVSETPALCEGGKNADSPRVTGVEGLGVRGESRKTKLYAYHIAAAYQAYTNPTPGLSERHLRSVAKDKSTQPLVVDQLSVMHLCGNKWCVEGAHLVVGSKKYNDQQTACHRGLQSATSLLQVNCITESYCQHTVKCWTLVYRGNYSKLSYHQWE